jgi:uncharacterized protein YbjT (DUF2867 family)
MKVILFGGTGMVGQGVLRECLLDDRVSEVLAVGRSPLGKEHAKLSELQHKDLLDLSAIEHRLAGYDACFFCLGVSSVGMDEDDYRRVTYDYTLSVANTLARLNPQSVFVYVSGRGTDSSEQGRLMWGRVKGKTENDLLALPLQGYMFRPGIHPACAWCQVEDAALQRHLRNSRAIDVAGEARRTQFGADDVRYRPSDGERRRKRFSHKSSRSSRHPRPRAVSLLRVYRRAKDSQAFTVRQRRS